MVARRGGEDPEVKQAVDDFLDRESLARHPNTGVLVSTTKASEVHEWARYAAGVFSHEVRSGMVGAADVDDDGEVSYDEIRAFVAAANAHVADPKAKLRAFALAPALDRREPFARPRASQRALSVVVPATLGGHSYLEDVRGVRVADFHAAHTLTLRVPPASTYFLHVGTDEIRLPAEGLRVVDAGQHPRVPHRCGRAWRRGGHVPARPLRRALLHRLLPGLQRRHHRARHRARRALDRGLRGPGHAHRDRRSHARHGRYPGCHRGRPRSAAHEADEAYEDREEGRSTEGGEALRTASTVLIGSALGLAVVGLGVWLWPAE
jgi:hypothetical protein